MLQNNTLLIKAGRGYVPILASSVSMRIEFASVSVTSISIHSVKQREVEALLVDELISFVQGYFSRLSYIGNI